VSLESDLYTLLSTDASISEVLNARPFVYNGAIPKGQPDSGAIVINVYRTDRLVGADGPNRFTVKEIQFDCYHAQYTQSVAIAYALIALIGNLSGSLATTEIQGCIPTREMDFGRESGDPGYVFRRLVAFEIQYQDLIEGDQANTYTPVAIPAPGGNATLLEGVLVSPVPPTDGQVLIFNAAAGQWEPGAVSGSGARQIAVSGAMNGVNTNFTLSVAPGAILFVFRNGEYLRKTDDYNLNGLQITFIIPPKSDDNVDIYTF
jgi:hypothetical protein